MTQDFRVWAPGRRRVEAAVDGRPHPMTRDAGGWWATGAVEARPGSRYGFSLDGEDPRPDPRSRSQPEGVLGLSEALDVAAHEWKDARWRGKPLAGMVLYELHVGTFSPEGTFDGAAARLRHLVDLGVDAVEIMPVAEFSGDRGWGYDGVDLFAPHHAYGGPAGLRRLVDSCHAAGLAVLVDAVYNHLGPVGNFLSDFGPYLSDRHHTAWGAALNFDGEGSVEVRRFVLDNVRMWIRDFHCDGLRLDAVHAIVDDSPVHILEEIADEVHALGAELERTTFVIAEDARNDPRLVRPREAGGHGLDAAWADDWHHALHTVLTGERSGYYEDFGSFEQLAEALRQAWVYDGVRSARLRTGRGAPPAGIAPDRFVIAAQNHDQVGNRAAGERLDHLAGVGRLKIAAALLLTSPFTPLLFQGEEWAASTPFQYFTDHADRDVGRAVSMGRREEFAGFDWRPEDVPDPQAPDTFERSRLRWEEIARSPHAEMLEWYRALIRFRRSLPAPRGDAGADVDVEADATSRRLAFRRPGVAVYVNLGELDWQISARTRGALALASCATAEVVHPDGVAVFAVNRDV